MKKYKIKNCLLVGVFMFLFSGYIVGCVQKQSDKLFIVEYMGRNYRCTTYKIAPLNGILVFINYDTGQEITIRDHYIIKSP